LPFPVSAFAAAALGLGRLTWPHRLWDFKKPHQWNGFSGGAGVGYTLPASLGAALANKKHGRFTLALGV
jgi:acetolactate synthase-1/2/3 large subunit